MANLPSFVYDGQEFPVLALTTDVYDGRPCTRLTMTHEAAHVAPFVFNVINSEFHPSFAGAEPEATVWID